MYETKENSHALTYDDCNVILGILCTADIQSNGEYFRKFKNAVDRIQRNERLRNDMILLRDNTEFGTDPAKVLNEIIQQTEDLT